ncbi:uncharacterized protein LOC131650025 [Vicia villosa]|uniref:uncharacterized protein LOC131650025 n=1 Tax=Vicia villosa TaxID=3911 RepID=UPI00273A8957|nr:uncharacterized protein LOC131650025 [Vicia villosa]
MGFGNRWVKWMELLVFKSSMSVLVNGSPTKEFEVFRGLRQGDPLSPFLYVIAAEGLSGLVRRSMALGEFASFKIRGDCSVDILQFADDTLLVGEGSWKHVWAIKAILRAFEIVSGLGINFHKSKLIGINNNDSFLEAATAFLSCKIEARSDVGSSIGQNEEEIGKLEKPMPLKVVKDFTRIQSNFLWGGVEDRRKIHWVSWNKVNLPFEKGGLWVKNIKLFNLALLSKWRWRILQGGNSLWLDVLKARYGDIVSQICKGGKIGRSGVLYSNWWKDIVNLGFDHYRDPIVNCCHFEIQNGFSTPFWEVA